MVHPTPEQVAASERTGIYWTQFPADALSDVNWTDHRDAHRAVMRLFPRLLEGPAGQRRAAAGILYRLDMLEGTPTVLVQSAVRPELTPGCSRTTEVSVAAWHLQERTPIVLRLAVNPVRRTTIPLGGTSAVTDGDRRDRGRQRQVAIAVPVAEVLDWLATRTKGAFDELTIVNHFRDNTGTGKHKVIVDTIDAVATVGDPTALDELRRNGIGRAKAYGCGLLTVHRAG